MVSIHVFLILKLSDQMIKILYLNQMKVKYWQSSLQEQAYISIIHLMTAYHKKNKIE